MIRLSHKAWNNVIMLVMMLMIFLFMFLSERLQQHQIRGEESGFLIPVETTLTELVFHDFSIERIGRGWRTQPEGKLPPEQVNQLVSNWMQTHLIASNEVNIENSEVVEVWLAGVEHPLRVELSALGMQVNGHTFTLKNMSPEQLLPKKN